MHAQEFTQGHVPGALNLTSTAFTDNAQVDALIKQLEHKSEVGGVGVWSA
jgi:3-mercaptopyruvate sulfurtransferase SseA